jgi:hypothetical protein
VVAAPTVQITGGELQPGGQEQGMNLYGRENVAAATPLTISVSGTAAPASAGNAQAGQSSDAQEGASSNIQVVPGRLDVLRWPLIIGFAALFGLGAFLLSRKTVVSVPAGVAASGVIVAAPPANPPAKPAQKARGVPAASAPGLAEMDAQVGTSLDALKERLFRLELRRQAGTISEEEYAQERSRAERVLRDLLRG